MAIKGTGQLTLMDMNDVTASSTAPSNPPDGALWFNTNDNKLYVYQGGGWKPSVDVGGRNLLRKENIVVQAGTVTKTILDTYHVKFVNTLVNNSHLMWNNTNGITIECEAGENITFSAEFKTNFKGEARLRDNGGSGNTSITTASVTIPNTSDKWVKVSVTTKALVDNPSIWIYFLDYRAYVEFGTAEIRNWKLEKGNVATDWTPAPEDLEEVVEDIQETLGNMANDDILDYNERRVIKEKLTDIIGYVIADNATVLPSTSTNDAGTNGKGSFYYNRKNAVLSGLLTSDSRYTTLQTKYENLKSYLEGFTPIDTWDISTGNKDTVIAISTGGGTDKATFRTKWLEYYQAELDLINATSEQLKKNADNIVVGGTNHASNGNFEIDLTKGLWKNEYVGQVKEIVDISTETPPFQFAYHVKNTTNAYGGIWAPVLWNDLIAESLVDKEITVSFWMKYQNIVQGSQSWNLGRFGEIIVEGETSGGSKVYRYPRVHLDNTATESLYFSGTNMTWKKYYATLKLNLPSTAVKLTNIQFKLGLEGCTGEFWTTGIKVEFGNKVTDWSPNPLDVQGRLVDVEFKVLPESIVSTVTESQEYVNLSNKVITGGRNYVLNSNFSRELRNWYPVDYYVNGEHQVDEEAFFGDSDEVEVVFENLFGQDGEDFNSSVIPKTENKKTFLKIKCTDDSKFQGIYQPISLEKNKDYTLSFKLFKKGNSNSYLYTDFYYGNILLNSIDGQAQAVIATETIQTFSFTFNNTNVMEENNFTLYTVTWDDELYITDIKIEEGEVATNWSSAIEDGEIDFLNINRVSTELKSQIEQTAGKISLIVSEENKINGEALVSAINLQPNQIKINSQNIDLNGVVTIGNAGHSPNLMLNGLDSFEQILSNTLPSPMTVTAGSLYYAGVGGGNGMGGSQGLTLCGDNGTYIRFNTNHPIYYGKKYFISFYWQSPSDYVLKLDVIGIGGTGTTINDAIVSTHLGAGWQRAEGSFTIGSWGVDFAIGLFADGEEIYIDNFMLEEAHPEQTKASTWKPASTTIINGNNIKTGTIDASVVNVVNINAGNITAGSISADRINGGTITGITVQTGTSGNRVVMSGTSLYSYGSSGGWAKFDNGQININQSGGSTDVLAGLIWITNSTYGTIDIGHDSAYGGSYIKGTTPINARGAWNFTNATVTGLTAKFG